VPCEKKELCCRSIVGPKRRQSLYNGRIGGLNIVIVLMGSASSSQLQRLQRTFFAPLPSYDLASWLELEEESPADLGA
jgi:hypothetical protein